MYARTGEDISKEAVSQVSRYNVGLFGDMRKQRRHDCSASGMKLFFPIRCTQISKANVHSRFIFMFMYCT